MLKNLEQPLEGIAWQGAAQHITLRFLGEISEANVANLNKRLEGIQHPAFPVTIESIGFFIKTVCQK